MKKLLTLFILISSFSFAQDFQGKAFYMSKLSVDKSWMDNPRFASRKAYLNDMIKKNTEKNYVLTFNSTESFYTEQEKIDVGEGGGYNWMATLWAIILENYIKIPKKKLPSMKLK